MRHRLVYILALGWLLAIIASVVHPIFTGPTGDGFTRGLNRIGVIIGWQAVALCLAIMLIFIITRTTKPRSWSLRIAGFGPIILSGIVVVVVVGSIVWARFSKPDPVSLQQPGAVTTLPAETSPVKPTTTN